MSIIIKKKLKLVIFAFLIIILIIESVYIIYLNNKMAEMKKELLGGSDKFKLLSPQIAWLDVDEFLEKQKVLTTSYSHMRPKIENILNSSSNNYGVYFEDLTTGAWIGINERSKYVPASLLKLPILVATLKKVETKQINLNDVITLEQEDIDYRSGSLAYNGVGYNITAKELITYLVNDSDNTALLAIARRYLTDKDITEANLAMGLPMSTPNETISPKEYSAIFRSLYYSSYLRRTFSEMALSIMLETDFNSQLPAGIPKDVSISHKVGIYYDEDAFGLNRGYFHDCGIIYLPQKPYILCVMSENSTQTESDTIIREISSAVYKYVVNEQ